METVPSAKPREGVQKEARQGYSLSSGYSEAEQQVINKHFIQYALVENTKAGRGSIVRYMFVGDILRKGDGNHYMWDENRSCSTECKMSLIFIPLIWGLVL